MKKLIKNNLIGFILGALIFGTVGVYAGATYLAKDVIFSSENFKATNVEDALDELYNRANGLYDGRNWEFDYTGKEQTLVIPIIVYIN